MVVAHPASVYLPIRSVEAGVVVADGDKVGSWGADDADISLFCTACGERWRDGTISVKFSALGG